MELEEHADAAKVQRERGVEVTGEDKSCMGDGGEAQVGVAGNGDIVENRSGSGDVRADASAVPGASAGAGKSGSMSTMPEQRTEVGVTNREQADKQTSSVAIPTIMYVQPITQDVKSYKSATPKVPIPAIPAITNKITSAPPASTNLNHASHVATAVTVKSEGGTSIARAHADLGERHASGAATSSLGAEALTKDAAFNDVIKSKGVSWMGAGVGERAGKSMALSSDVMQQQKRQELQSMRDSTVRYGFTDEQLMCLRAQILIYRRTRRAMQSGEKLTIPPELISIAGCKTISQTAIANVVQSTRPGVSVPEQRSLASNNAFKGTATGIPLPVTLNSGDGLHRKSADHFSSSSQDQSNGKKLPSNTSSLAHNSAPARQSKAVQGKQRSDYRHGRTQNS